MARLKDPWYVFVLGDNNPKIRIDFFNFSLNMSNDEMCKLLDFGLVFRYYYGEFDLALADRNNITPRFCRESGGIAVVDKNDILRFSPVGFDFTRTNVTEPVGNAILDAGVLTGIFPKLILGTCFNPGDTSRVDAVLSGNDITLRNISQMFLDHKNDIFTNRSALGAPPIITNPFTFFDL